MRYDFAEIEARWQQRWHHERTFRVPNPGDADFDSSRPKYYVLDMFPYPSGVGLHVGHPLGYIATDIVARYKRMRGFNVLHPMGFDAFGLPAEQFAVETGVHPRITTEKNIATMKRQLAALGLSYDWDREFATIEPDYYRWTQWIFLRLYHSWFDPEIAKARPIAELEAEFTRDARRVGTDRTPVRPETPGARAWADLDATERGRCLDAVRLAYMDEVSVNWCPGLGTVLANEEVTADGRSERGNFPVIKRPLRQWMLRITAYCDRLDADLDQVNWPESVTAMQRNWIGRSDGARVRFALPDRDDAIEVFTTRPDTLFGATYMVLAPEHPLVDDLVTDGQRIAVAAYRTAAALKTEIDRQAETAAAAKSGVFTGACAINPVNDERIPIWVADYVLMGYGTGAIMAVPAHDQRDFEFAKQFALPMRPVVHAAEWLAGEASAAGWDKYDETHLELYRHRARDLAVAFGGAGIAIDSTNSEVSLDGLETALAKQRIIAWLEATGKGIGTTQYKLRDWLFSRQRYWGEPFPILHGPDGEVVPLTAADLPVLLPPMEDFRPEASDDPHAAPRPPLARASEDWRVVERNGVRFQREFNTMPNWAGSCWYYLRFIDPVNRDRFVSSAAERYWMGAGTDHPGVDLYVGGVEHAVLHLLYARFWQKVLFDLGEVSSNEPFGRLYNQGYILAPSYTDARGVYVEAAAVEERDNRYYYGDEEVTRHVGKIGKSLKNSISPDDVCAQYGADTMRLYEMYLGPLAKSKLWNTRDILGSHRFLQRLWRNFIEPDSGQLKVTDEPASQALRRALHRTLKSVTHDMEGLEFNTAIARLIELNNLLVKEAILPREVAEPVVLMLAPLAPHIAEELWARLGHEGGLAYTPWPAYDERETVAELVEFPIQVNGKVKARIQLPPDTSEADAEREALAEPRIQELLAGKTVRKVIVVKRRLVSIVAD